MFFQGIDRSSRQSRTNRNARNTRTTSKQNNYIIHLLPSSVSRRQYLNSILKLHCLLNLILSFNTYKNISLTNLNIVLKFCNKNNIKSL